MSNFKLYTLSNKQKEFYWSTIEGKLIIEKKIKDIKYVFTKEELIDIINFTNVNGVVTLSNSLEKMKNILDERYYSDEYYTKGLGPLIYKKTQDNSKAQCISQIVAIFVDRQIFDYENKKPMRFWLKENALNKLNELFIS